MFILAQHLGQMHAEIRLFMNAKAQLFDSVKSFLLFERAKLISTVAPSD